MNNNDRPQLTLFGYTVDNLTLRDAADIVCSWATANRSVCRYVVTPNVKHFILLQKDADFRNAYRNADLVVLDSKPVAFLCWLFGMPVKGAVPGSDLVIEIFNSAAARAGLRVFLLGAAAGVADRASESIRSRWPWVSVVGTYSPRFGFECNRKERLAMLTAVRQSAPDLLIVGLGAPKQERWMHENRESVNANVALCVGAAIDFLAGEKIRAPLWLRHAGLEWAFRSVTEPVRIGWPTFKDGVRLPRLIFRQWIYWNLRSRSIEQPTEARRSRRSRPDGL